MTAGRALEDSVTRILSEILTGIDSRADIHQHLSAVLGEDEGADVVMVVMLGVTAALSGKSIAFGLLNEPLGLIEIALKGSIVRSGVIVDILIVPDELTQMIRKLSASVSAVLGIVDQNVGRVFVFEVIEQPRGIGEASAAVRKAYGGIFGEEHLLQEGRHCLYLVALPPVDLAVRKLIDEVGVQSEEAEAVAPISATLEADTVVAEAGKESLHRRFKARKQLLDLVGIEMHHHTRNGAGTNCGPVGGAVFPPAVVTNGRVGDNDPSFRFRHDPVLDQRIETVAEKNEYLGEVVTRFGGEKVHSAVIIRLKLTLVRGEAPGVFVTDRVDHIHGFVYVLFFLGINEGEEGGVFETVALAEILCFVYFSVTRRPEQLEVAVTKRFDIVALTMLIPHSVEEFSVLFVGIAYAHISPELLFVSSFK